MDIEKIYSSVSRYADQAAIKVVRAKIEQVRFSNNEIDISNSWNTEGATVFVAKDGKTFAYDIKDEKDIEKTSEFARSVLGKIEKNNDFFGINDMKQSYRKKKVKTEKISEIDPESTVNDFIDEVRPFVKRIGGVFYRKEIENEVKTTFNQGKEKTTGIELVARAFNDYDFPAQVSFMTASDEELPGLERSRAELIDLSKKVGRAKEGQDGKYTVLFHPLCFASIASYAIPMASAFQVDSGMSLFAGRMNQKIGASEFTLYDDPTDDSMIGSRVLDDEGTSTRKTAVIEKGVVKNLLHNNSTAKKYRSETTGNAGVIVPNPWQIQVESGSEDYEDMISSTKNGLFIVNTWYTRFQDYREGIFSTIPRDGIFKIKNGEIEESWTGIRISDSLLNLFKNIQGISRQTEKVKWWDETLPTKSPYVEVSEVNISKSK